MPLSLPQLNAIVGGQAPEFLGLSVPENSTPPFHVAQRALASLAAGCEPFWVVPFNIVDLELSTIVGGIGFKGMPVAGEVEVGYGICPAFWRRGYAQWGLSELLQLARCSGSISRVLATIAPLNVASCSLVAKLGFVRGAEFTDSDGEQVLSWHWQCTT